MKECFPCSDYIETRGINFFARMLDKIRLNAKGLLPEGYNLGFSDPTSFDARFCRFWLIEYDTVLERTLQGGSNEEIFDDVFEGRDISDDEILVWNEFLVKRGWRDGGSRELQQLKTEMGMGDRSDIQTFVDLHDVDEGRKPKYSEKL
jgi:gluconokinase